MTGLTWGCSWGRSAQVPVSCCRRRRHAGSSRCSAPAAPPPRRAAPPAAPHPLSAGIAESTQNTLWDCFPPIVPPGSLKSSVTLPNPSGTLKDPKGPNGDLGHLLLTLHGLQLSPTKTLWDSQLSQEPSGTSGNHQGTLRTSAGTLWGLPKVLKDLMGASPGTLRDMLDPVGGLQDHPQSLWAPGVAPTWTSMAVMSSTTRFMTARTLRGSTVPNQSRVSTLFLSICATAAPWTCT